MRRLVGLAVVAVILCSTVSQADPPAKSRGLDALVKILSTTEDPAIQRDVLRGMQEALQGRTGLTAPKGWDEMRARLSQSRDSEVREKLMMLSVLFGDRTAIAETRKIVTDLSAETSARQTALQALVEAQTADLLPLLRSLLADRKLRGQALRALAGHGDDQTPELVIKLYPSFDDSAKVDALAALASRPVWCRKLLDAMEKGTFPHAISRRLLPGKS